jgi:hypothetical protein
MKALDYKTPALIRPANWYGRYIIAVSAIIACHYLGSLIWCCYATYRWSDDPDSVIYVILMDLYQFPMSLIGGHGGIPSIYSTIGNFALFAIIDAIFWGFCIIGFWHVISIIYQQFRTQKRNIT